MKYDRKLLNTSGVTTTVTVWYHESIYCIMIFKLLKNLLLKFSRFNGYMSRVIVRVKTWVRLKSGKKKR